MRSPNEPSSPDTPEDWREDAEELEELSETLRLRRQSISDGLADAMAAGDRVSVSTGSRKFSGRLVAAIGDLAVLENDELEASINLAGPVAVAATSQTSGGFSGSAATRSFIARLREFELSGEQIEVVGDFGSVTGVVVVVAKDHLRINDGEQLWFLLLTQVGILIRPIPPSPSLY